MIKQLSLTIGLVLLLNTLAPTAIATPDQSSNLTTQIAVNQAIAEGLRPSVAKRAIYAYEKALKEGVSQSNIFTIIDYTLPSTRKRLWVLDMCKQKVLYNTFVTHGEGSGSLFAKYFSNTNGSHKTSLGLYKTKNSYYGAYGYALRLVGLERGINDHALSRAIVFHGAPWVSAASIHRLGALPMSYACPTVPIKLVRPIVSAIKGGSLIFMYADDNQYLQKSHFVA